MLGISAANAEALAAASLVHRDFLWIVPRDRTTGDLAPVGFWSDVTTINAAVLNPDTGSSTIRPFNGAGQLIKIGAVPRVANVSVQTVTIELSQIDDAVDSMVRGYDLKFARVEIYRGLLSVETRLMVGAALNRFVGLVDHVEIRRGKEGEEGSCTLTCVSHTQELTRANPARRSHEDQILRSPTDDFFKDANVVGDWHIKWGKPKPQKAKKKKFLGLF